MHAGIPVDDYLEEDLPLTKLLSEYAEKDQHYEGISVESVCVVMDSSSPSDPDQDPPNPPILMCVLRNSLRGSLGQKLKMF